tara:strand:- start:6868 stop:7215 length:348 start_codon:yes stop_codon:yes gene_type:complete
MNETVTEHRRTTFTAIDIGKWPNFMNYAWGLATNQRRHLPEPQTIEQAVVYMTDFTTFPKGTQWGLNDEGITGLWIHDLDLFLEENKAEIQSCIEEGEHVLSMDEIRKCTIKESE